MTKLIPLPTDVLTPEQRSYCMSRIRGRDTKPEIHLRMALWSMGLRYRLKSKIIGKPDLVFPGARVAVFVDGCQWHCCPQHWVRPKSNTAFWDRKFDKNRRRDAKVNERLAIEGWKVLRFWEHDVERNCGGVVAKISRKVSSRLRIQCGRKKR
jgi:DNA mismatch endonuclease, patch repair protein